MSRLLNFLSISLSAAALLSVIWIVVPAPASFIWLYSVAVSEWSLWFSLLALIAIACALLVGIFFGGGNLWLASIIIGTVAFFISLYPLISSFSAAREQNVSLSLRQYFSGVAGNGEPPETRTKNFSTYTFARVDEIDLQLDVYTPPDETAGNGAGVIVIHGGSWRGGARNDFPQWNRWLARQGFTVFDIDYRLAPPPNYLTATGDVKCAIQWVKERAAEFKIEPARIVLLGRSAGGHLALLAAYSAGDNRLPSACAEQSQNEKVRAVISVYGSTDLLWGYDNPANQMVIDGPGTLSRFLGGSPRESAEIRERYVLASPISHVSSDAPPTLLIHGGRDQLVSSENMNILAAKLKETNAPHKALYIPYAQHGFDYNFNGWGAQVSKSVILDFLRENTQVK